MTAHIVGIMIILAITVSWTRRNCNQYRGRRRTGRPHRTVPDLCERMAYLVAPGEAISGRVGGP